MIRKRAAACKVKIC